MRAATRKWAKRAVRLRMGTLRLSNLRHPEKLARWTKGGAR
jgi:hypothetical protein